MKRTVPAAIAAACLATGAAAQDLEFARLSNAMFGTDVVIDVVNGGEFGGMLTLAQRGNYSGQFWLMRDIGVPGYFALSSEFTGPDQCLDLWLHGELNNMPAMNPCTGDASQQWTVLEKGDGFAWVHNRHRGGTMCLSFSEGGRFDGLLILEPCDDDAPEQFWLAEPTGRYAE
ncbi:hypothetical protein LNKW23_29740 [Paralimibaculum aggregatum]|uniref:Ricin B lectin domain-containing protein n=1 Tax=Paralimibaculum aggregatum TaxID=3036245 RepID=A0ABQ6LKI3_9RHOB|nr:ricin-type beta-trefoil lectin domain protein [Limibaculum sp. NKW23]GMG83760.1 hypothetical protein LNKW23_29740 [Limibaculum sp. NKW23]